MPDADREMYEEERDFPMQITVKDLPFFSTMIAGQTLYCDLAHITVTSACSLNIENIAGTIVITVVELKVGE